MAGPTDTIFARASGAGKAGVSVFRLSGSSALDAAHRLVPIQIKNRRIELTTIANPETGEVIDRGLVIPFMAPSSYTGEDVVEFHLHGSAAVESALYEALSAVGCRPAERGEFTLRALKNGKMDLAQTEALADLIDSETSVQRKQALGQLDGRLSAVSEGWRARLLAIMAPLEADIDFPDEGDVPAAVAARAGPEIDALITELKSYLADATFARRIRKGVSVAIIGAPNAGKSSLLNALAGSDVAIVSATPGTTRDIVEARLDLAGIVATLADTAGLRTRTNDPIEAEGMDRARARAADADLRILVVDPTSVSRETPAEVAPEGLALLTPGDFIVWSKADLGSSRPEIEIPVGAKQLAVSATTGDGMPALLSALKDAVAGDSVARDASLTRRRHIQAVEEAVDALERARAGIERTPEMAAEDARLAIRSLGTITGAVGVEDVLGEIFSSFCIGK